MDDIRVLGVHDNLKNVQPGDVIPVVRGQVVITFVAIVMLDGLFGRIGK